MKTVESFDKRYYCHSFYKNRLNLTEVNKKKQQQEPLTLCQVSQKLYIKYELAYVTVGCIKKCKEKFLRQR